MFSQFRHVVEGLAQPRPLQASPPRSGSNQLPSAKPLLKAKLEDRLRASFTIGEVSNPSTPTASTRASPAPQFVAEHPLAIDHPLSPAAIPLPNSPPPNDDRGFPPIDTSLTLPDPLSSMSPGASDKTSADAGSNDVIEPEPVNQESPQSSPLVDSPIISQVSEQKPAASEESTGAYDATQSIIASDSSTSCDQASIMSNASVVEIPQPAEIPVPTEEAQSGPSFPDGVEALQERLKLMEQQFAGQS